MIKNMVIHCATGIKNSGDEAILNVLINRYKDEYQIKVISLNVEYSRKIHHKVLFISNYNIQQWKVAIRTCDIFVLGGGGLIQDSTSIYNVSRWLQKLKFAVRCNKAIYVYANSIGPLQYKFNRKLVSKYLKKATRITVRDLLSLRILGEMGISGELSADPVFSMNKVSEDIVSNIKFKVNLSSKYVVVSVRNWFDTNPFIPVAICTKFELQSKKSTMKYRSYISAFRETIQFINKEIGLPVVLVCFCEGRDNKVAQDIINSEELIKHNCLVDEKYLEPNEIRAIIQGAEFIIGMRLHSIIYAVTTLTPVIPIIYEKKVLGIVSDMRLQDLAINIDNINSKELIIKIRHLLQNKNKYVNIINKYDKSAKQKEKLNYII